MPRRCPSIAVAANHVPEPRRPLWQAYAGSLSGLFEEYLNYYAVVADDGSVITVAPRLKKVQH